MVDINPFDTPALCTLCGTHPAGVTHVCTGLTSSQTLRPPAQPPKVLVGGPLVAAVATTRERLQEDVRRHAKELELKVSTLKADNENLRLDVERLQMIAESVAPSATTQNAQQQLAIEHERAERLEREIVNLRQLQEHTVAAGALNRAALARALANIGEIGKLLDVGPQDDGAQIRRAIELLVTRSAVLDQVLDNVLDDMSTAAKAMLTDLQPNFGKGRATAELQTMGALSTDDTGRWNWTTIGEVLRQRRAEHLGTQRRTGEYKAT